MWAIFVSALLISFAMSLKLTQFPQSHLRLTSQVPTTALPATSLNSGLPSSRGANNKAARDALFEQTYKVVDCTLGDLQEIIRLSYAQFESTCKTTRDKAELKKEIMNLFLPKFVFTPFLGHRVIGLRDKTQNNRLVGFVDVSMQTQTLDALKPVPYLLRVATYGSNLRPYLCNLLVAPYYRRRGLGARLVKECISVSKEWNQNELYLHVKESTTPALKLYFKLGFEPVMPKEQYATCLKKTF